MYYSIILYSLFDRVFFLYFQGATQNIASETVNQETKPSYAVIPGAGKPSIYMPAPKHPIAPDDKQLVAVDPNASLTTQEIQRELQVLLLNYVRLLPHYPIQLS